MANPTTTPPTISGLPSDFPVTSIPVKTEPSSTWDLINPLSWLDKLNDFKAKFNLPNPGVFEHLHNETKNVFPSNLLIDGASFDFIKTLSPHVQLNNSFSLGSAQTPSAFNFVGVYADEKLFFQGAADNEINYNARLFYTLGRGFTAKALFQSGLKAPQSMLQLESDYTGPDCAVNLKTINGSFADRTGILVASYLQSLTKNLAIGSEALIQKTSPQTSETALSFVAKYATPESILTATLHDQGVMQTSYFHKISDMVEAGVDLQLIATSNKRDAICTVGAKFEFKGATMRTSIDTSGKVSTFLEERIAPPLSLLLSGELDHYSGSSRFGLGVRFSA